MKILIYPKAHNNPYHQLLYGSLEAAHPTDTFEYLHANIATLALFPLLMIKKRLSGYRIFHLHWHAFYIAAKYPIPFRKQLSLVNTLWSLTVLKLLGFKVIWTIHNVMPHEAQTSNDRLITQYTCKISSGLIVHADTILEELKAFGIDTTKARVIPHGNYDNAYPRTLNRTQARKKLAIRPNETAILFLGNIRPYKGVEDQLLPAFAKLDDPHARLIIAGQCNDPQLRDRIATAAQADPRITFTGKLVPDENISAYFDAADIVCLPFTVITTSGTVILAATYGRPIIAPRLGAVADIPQGVGILYDPSKKDALANAVRNAVQHPQKRIAMAKASRAYADTIAWEGIAAKTYAVYESALLSESRE